MIFFFDDCKRLKQVKAQNSTALAPGMCSAHILQLSGMIFPLAGTENPNTWDCRWDDATTSFGLH